MKCPKCNYTSFDYLENCKNCGVDLRDARSLLQIIAVSPEDQAPAAPIVKHEEEEPLEERANIPESSFLKTEAFEDQGEILGGLDFDGSFDELVEPTSYADQEVETTAPKPQETTAEPDDEELLDLDFGDLFEEKEK